MKLRCNGLFVGLAQLFIILGVGFSTLFVNFSNAYQDDCGNSAIDVQQVFTKGISQSVNNTNGIFELQDNANFLFDDTSKVFHYGDNSNGAWLFWNEFTLEGENYSQLYLLVVRRGNIDTQGYVQYYTYVPIGKVCIGNSNNISNFYEGNTFSSPDTLSYYANLNYRPEIAICLGYSDLDTNVCFNYNNLTGSLGIGMGDLENLEQLYGDSKWTSTTPTIDININPVCPTIGQKKANSGLSPEVCYAGFPEDYSNGNSFIAGSGISIKSVYEMYSGGMSYQGWYDTYYQYYKDINNHLDIFSGNKLLMGTFFSRQTFGRDKTSQQILNYCHLVLDLGNMSDNTSCCVAQCNLTDVSLTEQDFDSIIEELIGRGQILSESGSSYSTGDIFDYVDRQYHFWKGFNVVDGYVGILPGYIVIGFLGILLLYFLRR